MAREQILEAPSSASKPRHRLRYMLIVVLEVKNVPTNYLLVPSSLRIESKNPQTHPEASMPTTMAFGQAAERDRARGLNLLTADSKCWGEIRT